LTCRPTIHCKSLSTTQLDSLSPTTTNRWISEKN